jgi:porphobilinogen synthase
MTSATPSFPSIRMRRNRRTPWLRRLVQETRMTPNDFIWPVFVIGGKEQKIPVDAMPGVFRYSPDMLVDAVQGAKDLGIPMVAIFPFVDPALKTSDGAEAWNNDNLVCQAVRVIKDNVQDIGVMCDVALDPFNSDGHDGLVQDGIILNDETVECLVKQSISQAQVGCDVIAPSDMMDGRIGAIRAGLDGAGFQDVAIMSYAAKFASGFYDPFRDAIGSGGALVGDKKTYQMSPANSNEALREVALDISEGADMVMVKPGLPYLDIVQRIKEHFHMPTFVYNVSGEYAMLRSACDNGLLDYNRVMMETMQAFKRAGSDGILTYHAIDAATLLNR